jgi:cystinosin
LNVLGFWCYAISTASFLYSPTIRSQYAYRHPDAPETTVRFNDFLFAAHGAAMCVIIYSQFFPRVWGFTVGRTQRVSRAVLGIFWGLVTGVVIVVLIALFFGKDLGYDASGWAWIDVVSSPSVKPALLLTSDRFMPLGT